MAIEKTALKLAIQACQKTDYSTQVTKLLKVLGYSSSRTLSLDSETPGEFLRAFDLEEIQNRPSAKFAQWKAVKLLFQLTDEELNGSGQLSFDHGVKREEIQSYLFLSLDLAGEKYSRTELANITREVNRGFMMPVFVMMRYAGQLTIGIVHRRPSKKDEGKDVLEKVTLIKDICISEPHRGHIEILYDLALGNLGDKVNSFSSLQKKWEQILNSSELNKRFYREIANWYFWAFDQVRFPEGAGKDEENRNATSLIRLITRIIFVWFIKEKQLIPEEIFDDKLVSLLLRSMDGEESTYYKAILQNLFFATLNQEMNKPGEIKRKFRTKNPVGLDGNYGIPNMYRYEDSFRDPQKFLDLLSGIPFLNGGLFECLDQREKKILIDGFSDIPANQPVVPNFLFWSDDTPVDLNAIYDTRNKKYSVRGLIKILNAYKFTIEENTSLEEDVALDPELLGKVFENLLAAYNPETKTTARKQTGSFYTPREIVNYMVDESLFAFFENQMANIPDIQNRLRNLLAFNHSPHLFDSDEVELLINAIDSIKVLDPACGSGAFPMGILNKLVYVLTRIDPGNLLWKKKQIDKAARIQDPSLRNKILDNIEMAFNNNENELDYGRKLYLIENCIYGVDIQPIAVQITKLRFFIALVVDQKVNRNLPDLGICPLPNLEMRFVAANSLISIAKPQQMSLGNLLIDTKKEELSDIRDNIFTARTPATKRKHREKFISIQSEIAELLIKDGWGNETAKLLVGWNPFNQNASADFFDPEWMFDVKGGFDVVIGNPPYMRIQVIQQTQPEFTQYYLDNYQSAKGSFDLYALFIEKGYSLLNNNGRLSYIVPHKFFQAAFGNNLRQALTKRKALYKIVRFGVSQVFEEATTYTCLLFLTAIENNKFELIEIKSLERSDELFQSINKSMPSSDYSQETLPEPSLNIESSNSKVEWDFSIGNDNKVMKRMQQYPKRLGDIVRKIFQGIATSADKIFVLEILKETEHTYYCFSKQLGEEVVLEKGLVKPFLMGKDVHRYEPVSARNVVIFPYQILNGKVVLMPKSFIQDNFPLGWQYLKRNMHDLGERERGRMHGEQFYSYIYPKNLTEFGTVKIMTPDICNGPQMTIDYTGNLYHTTTIYSFAFKSDQPTNKYYYLGLLNSHLLWYFISLTGTVLRGGYLRFKTEYLKPFPIASTTPGQEQCVATLVKYILYLKALPEPTDRDDKAKGKLIIAYFEQLIDGLLYEIYFPEEFSDAGKSICSLLSLDQIPPIEKIQGDKTIRLHKIFEEIFNISHPVRQLIFFLDTIESVRIIEGRVKGI
jgi:adenine-specific DNA-methyltransferase